MARPRVPETDQGIQDEMDVVLYDRMMRRLRDRSWMETSLLLRQGLTSGLALELGPGPGYLGLEWLAKTRNTRLIGLDLSQNIIRLARRNAREYQLEKRVRYVCGDAALLPFTEGAFDAVFSNGSLHEWADPGLAHDSDRVAAGFAPRMG
jgi:ubiquinone/menaquinone biosynthesis C-methylase UbiE